MHAENSLTDTLSESTALDTSGTEMTKHFSVGSGFPIVITILFMMVGVVNRRSLTCATHLPDTQNASGVGLF